MKKYPLIFTFSKGKALLIFIAAVFLTGTLIPDAAFARNGRYLQEVNLNTPVNQPYLSASHSLPLLADKGIREGKIIPFNISYEAGTIKALPLAEYKSFVELPRRSIYSLNYEDELYGEAGVVYPWQLKVIKLDVLKENGQVNKINYIHFWTGTADKAGKKYFFSVSFPELAAYLNGQRSLWVKNSNFLIWKNQVPHTDNRIPEQELQERFFGELLHFSEGRPWEKKEFGIYSFRYHQYQLVHKDKYEKIAPDTAGADILLLSEALRKGRYEVLTETPIITSLPEPVVKLEAAKSPDRFVIIQKEDLELQFPLNEKFYQPGKELSTLILKAAEQGLIKNIYWNDSLLIRMSGDDLSKKMSYTDYAGPAENGIRKTFTGRQVAVVRIGWKTNFNKKGEITRAEPHSITLFTAPNLHPDGMFMPIASFAFGDVEKALQKLPELKDNKTKNLVSDLRKRKYHAFFTTTSGIMAADAPKAK